VYSVDDVRVILEGDRWQCVCSAHAQRGQCIHIEKASIFRHMRGVRRDEDTIEMELTTAQQQAMARAGADDAILPGDDALSAAPAAAPVLRRPRWSSLVAAAAIAGISSGVTYLATSQAEQVRPVQHHLAEATPAAMPVAAPPLEPPVRFINPFDATEVFEFPPGTTQSDARQAVADFLLQRARDRYQRPTPSLAQRG
jgi:hypothetical protein